MLAAAAMTAGLSTAQDTPTDTPPTQEQLKEEAAKPVDPAQLKKDISYFLGFQNGQKHKITDDIPRPVSNYFHLLPHKISRVRARTHHRDRKCK